MQQREESEIESVGPLLDELNASSVLLVVDRAAYEASGAARRLAQSLSGRRVVLFDDFSVNPKLDDADRGVRLARANPCGAILAVGGGTAIDMAKLIRCFSAHSCSADELLVDEQLIEHRGKPLIAVPTTSGTGSESTAFAVVYGNGVKYSLAHRTIMPEAAVIDWRLAESLPPRLTAQTGLDALCQAVESLWSIHSSEQSIAHAVEAVELIVENLEAAVVEPTSDARRAMSRAAHLAGKAINVSKTTAPHAISYTITHDYGVAHGHAAALTLGAFLEFNGDASTDDTVDPRGSGHVRQMIDLIVNKLRCQNAAHARARIDALMTAIGCETKLSRLGISAPAEIRRIAESANASRMSNNPRLVTPDQVAAMLDSIR